jgi:multidrug efflux pump subunit AcrA (membrane-fusion protein)
MPLGYVVDFSGTIVRVIVSQADVDHIRRRTARVEARFAESLPPAVPAYIEIEPYLEVNISSQAPGIIDRVLVERGDLVKKGQVVATLRAAVGVRPAAKRRLLTSPAYPGLSKHAKNTTSKLQEP